MGRAISEIRAVMFKGNSTTVETEEESGKNVEAAQ
nr:MAG TPA: hypothetical protein [Caudoviricetes sp.]